MTGDNQNNSYSLDCHFGEHLTIDGYGGVFDRLNDKGLVHQVLEELPELLKMNKLCNPHVYHAPDNSLKDPGGWSGFVVVAESHISIHTFPKRGFLSADVYTCQNGLDIAIVVEYFKKTFGMKDIETNFIKRGTCYPAQNIC